MQVCGIIAEYNPLHYGHQYHLQRAREITGADYIIVVMSGCFVQRGEPAIIDQHLRTAMALRSGADLVLELPISTATGTAEHFAQGGVEILHSLGCVTDLVCGAEAVDSDFMEALTEILVDEPEEYRQTLQKLVRQGLLFAAARAQAAEELLPGAASLLSSPNNILAMEYRKAIRRIPDCRIRPHEIARKGAGYNDSILPDTALFASASSIRQAIREHSREDLLPYIPREFLSQLTYPLFADDMTQLLNQTLILQETEKLLSCQDMTPDLLNRLLRQFAEKPYLTFSQRAQELTNRQITRTRANRALLHCILGIQEETRIPALRILGFRRSAGPLLRWIQDHSRIPLVTKLADADSSCFRQDLRAEAIYQQLLWQKYGIESKNPYRQGITILP